MEEKNLKKCKACNADIAKGAKVCPQCGQKNKKPIYLRPWFIVIAVVFVVALISNSGGESDNTNVSNINADIESNSDIGTESSTNANEQTAIEYTSATVAELIDILETNAMKAETDYNNKYVEITGRLGVIDSDGKYITLYPGISDFEFTGVQCYMKNDEQKNKIINMNIGDTVTLKGKIKSVGEVLGYSLNIDSIQ